LPLLVHTTPANVRDDLPAVEMVKRLPSVQGPRGRPRRKPHSLLGDRGYGFPWIIAAILAMRITSLLSPRGSEHGSGLGKRRYVVEQTLAAFSQCRRIKLCYEREGMHFQAFHELAAILICFRRLKQVTAGF
jgi:transposase